MYKRQVLVNAIKETDSENQQLQRTIQHLTQTVDNLVTNQELYASQVQALQGMVNSLCDRGCDGLSTTPASNSNATVETATTGVTVFPNPFSETVRFDFFIEQDGPVTFFISDTHGRKVTTLSDNTFMKSGHHQLTLDGHQLLPGEYYFTLLSGGILTNGKVTLQR